MNPIQQWNISNQIWNRGKAVELIIIYDFEVICSSSDKAKFLAAIFATTLVLDNSPYPFQLLIKHNLSTLFIRAREISKHIKATDSEFQ